MFSQNVETQLAEVNHEKNTFKMSKLRWKTLKLYRILIS